MHVDHVADELNEQDLLFMKEALHLAQQAKGKTSPNPAVGAVIVKDSKIVGRGMTQQAGRDHAEIQAINATGPMIENSTLYVTLEPCCFQQRTLACTNRIIQSGIQRVIAGVIDPNPKVKGKGLQQLKEAGIRVSCGLLQNDINTLNEDFNYFIQTGLPFCTAKYAMTLDGKIATRQGYSKWISNPSSRIKTNFLRSCVDAIMIGVNSVIRDNPKLNVREPNKGKNPLRIVLDSFARTPIDSELLVDDIQSLFVLKSLDLSAKVDHAIKDRYHRFIEICQTYQNKQIWFDPHTNSQFIDRIHLPWLMKELGQSGIISVFIEGGNEVLTNAIEFNLIHKLICVLSTKILIGDKGISPFSGRKTQHIVNILEQAYRLNRISVSHLEDDIMISGYLDYH